jgi:hypothetical protein
VEETKGGGDEGWRGRRVEETKGGVDDSDDSDSEDSDAVRVARGDSDAWASGRARSAPAMRSRKALD